MPKSKKPRRKPQGRHGNREVVVLPSILRIGGVVETLLKLIPHQALCALVDGEHGEVPFNTLAVRLNMTYLMLTELFDNPDEVEGVAQGLRALKAMRDRLPYPSPSPEERAAVGWALVVADEVQMKTTRREQDAAILKAAKLVSD